MIKISLLPAYSLLYLILKIDVHTGKCGQGVLQSLIDAIEAIASLYMYVSGYHRDGPTPRRLRFDVCYGCALTSVVAESHAYAAVGGGGTEVMTG